MKLWTVQEISLLEGQADPIISTRTTEEPYWLLSYGVMHDFYKRTKSRTPTSPLIWTWHDSNYFSYQDEQLDMVSTVESDVEHLKTKCVINLNVPDDIPLLSSYSKWNRLMEYCATFNRAPSCLEDWTGILEVNNIADYDYIQAVIPEIQRSWIVDIVDLDLSKLRT